MPKHLLAIFVAVALSGSALAQTEALADYLARVQDTPGFRASLASREAARLQLQNAYDPVSLDASLGYARLPQSESGLPDFLTSIPGIEDLFASPTSSTSVSLSLRFRPAPFGDISDLVRQRQLELASAQLRLRDTLTQLETQAVEGALRLELAQEGLVIAEEGLALAEEVLAATELRRERGAATPAELRDANLRVREARDRVRQSEADLDVARLSLRQLVGDARLGDVPNLPRVRGEPLDVLRAQLDAERAQIGVRSSERELYPTAQATYNYQPSDESTFSLSVESRTLQPSLSYSYQSAAGGGGGLGGLLGGGGSQPTFQVGVSMTISPGTLNAYDAARAQRDAAQAGLEQTRNSSALQLESLQNALEAAERSLDTAQLNRLSAQLSLDEARSRLDLGLATDLERQQAFVSLQQAELNLRSARLERLRRLLDIYRYYAIPISEVLE
ncbi:MAG: TolC family protein [Trueperaceae bacterium]|nr:TolC family protein [Trueperaceae bacterium]